MYYTIYKTTNMINGKSYIGKHKTNNPNDNYLGSGLRLINAIKKYGINNFTKEILFIFDNEIDMNEKEKLLVNESVVKNNLYYNIALGGQGGQIILIPDHPRYDEVCSKISKKALERSEQNSLNIKELHKKKMIGMYNKKHTDETKHKIRNAHLGKDVSIETRQKLSIVLKGKIPYNKNKKMSDIIGDSRANELAYETSIRNKKLFVGSGNPMYGKKHSVETKEKQSIAAKNVNKITCEHCSRTFRPSTYARWHGDNCAKRTQEIS